MNVFRHQCGIDFAIGVPATLSSCIIMVMSESATANRAMQIASRSLIPANHVIKERLRPLPRPGELLERAGADRREVNPSIHVEAATWSRAGQLDYWVKERREWLGRVRGPDGRQRWIRAVDFRPGSGSQP
jgi:hypothetical protein